MPTPARVDYNHLVVRVSTLRAPNEFEELANPARQHTLSGAVTNGMSDPDVGLAIRAATYRMPLETHVVVGSFLPAVYP